MSIDEVYLNDPTVSRAEALAEIESNGYSQEEFFEDMGDKNNYSSLDVCQWMGY